MLKVLVLEIKKILKQRFTCPYMLAEPHADSYCQTRRTEACWPEEGHQQADHDQRGRCEEALHLS